MDSADIWDVVVAEMIISEEDTRNRLSKLKVKRAVSIFDKWEQVVYKQAYVELLCSE